MTLWTCKRGHTTEPNMTNGYKQCMPCKKMLAKLRYDKDKARGYQSNHEFGGNRLLALERDNNRVKQAERRAALNLLVTDLTATLAHEYPKTFERDKFNKACGL